MISCLSCDSGRYWFVICVGWLNFTPLSTSTARASRSAAASAAASFFVSNNFPSDVKTRSLTTPFWSLMEAS